MIDTLYLIANIAGTRVAFRSCAIESVVIVRNVSPVPCAPTHMAGLFALRSRVMSLIDTRVAIGFESAGRAEGEKAIVVDVDGHFYGLLVDGIEDACFVSEAEMPIQGRLADGWHDVATAMIEHDGATLLVIDAAQLVTPRQKAA
ncbi:MAG: chemotaxis protein CheW [Sphingomonadales bacterium]|nr:chemotaxis protein CheW [Sphingomonadales bacterium]